MSSRLEELRKAFGISTTTKTTTVKSNSTLMEQATGAQATAAPKPTVVKPAAQAAQTRQYGMTDSGTGRSVDAVMPQIIKPTVASPARQAEGVQALEQMLHQPNQIADIASRDNMAQMAARANLNQDTTTADAGRSYQQNLIEKQKENLQAQISSVMAQIEAAADARDNQARMELSQTLSDLRGRMDKLDNRAAELNISETSGWEERQYNEIIASGGNGLLLTLEKLSGLNDEKIRQAIEAGDERRSSLTETEQEYFAKYDELKAKYGDKVDSWLDYVERMKNSQQMDKLLKNARAAAADKPFWSSLGSIGLNAVSGGGYMDIVGQKLQRFATGSDTPIDYNSPAQRPARATQAIRGEVSKDMGSVGKFLYNTGMSLGDSAVAIGLNAAGLGGLGTVLLGGAAATNATHAAAERGASDEQALLVGLIAGASETLLEKASIDSLFGLKDPKSLKEFIFNALKQSGAEGTEEGLTNIVNTIADGIIMRDKSELEILKRKLMANGMNREQAKAEAIKEWAKGFALDVAGGMLSGAVTSGGKGGLDYMLSNRGNSRTAVDNAMPTIPQQEQTAQPVTPAQPNVPTVDNVMPKVQPDHTNTTPTTEQIVRPDEQIQTAEDKMPAMGAADEGFNPYSHYQSTQSEFLPEGANAARPVDVPAVDPTGKPTKKFLSTAMGAQAVNEGTDAQMQKDFMEGKYGHEVKGDKAAVDKAHEKLKTEGYDRLAGATLEKLAELKDLKQTVVDAQLLALEAQRNGKDADAAELILMLSTVETEFGQAVQAASIFRKLTPEGQLEGVRRVASRLAAKTKKNGGSQGTAEVSAEEQGEIMQTVDDVRETALRLLGNIHEAFSEKDHGVPVEDWLGEIGKKLANTIASKPKTPEQKPKTISSTIRSDLLQFAKDYLPKAPKAEKAPKRTAVDTLRDFFANREQYAKAWNAAQAEYRRKYGWDGGFAGATITYNASGSDPVLVQAIVDEAAAQKLKELNVDIITYLGDMEALADRISDSLIEKTGAANADAELIRDGVKRYLTEKKLDANLDEIGKGLDNSIQKAIKNSGDKMYDIIRRNKDSKAVSAKKIADILISQYGISHNAAKEASGKITERFYDMVSEQSEKALESMFAEAKKNKIKPKSAVTKISEMEGLGAFENERYADAAAERASRYMDADIQKAIREIGAKTSDIIRSNQSDKDAVAQKVTDMLMKDHQLSAKDAKKMADFILKKFNEHVASSSEKALESMFKDRGKKLPKTVMQRFSELANMGAFTGSKYNQKATQKLFGEGLMIDPDLAQKFLDAPDEESREAAMEEIYKDLGEQMDTSFGEILTRWRYTAMLLNPSTHVKNVAGSATLYGMGLVKDALATPVEAIANKITKGKTGRTKAFLNPKNKADHALLETAGKFYDQHQDDIMGESKYRDTPAGKINQYKTVMKLNNPKTKVGHAVDSILRGVGKVADANAAAMDTEDTWISRPRFQAALAGYMKANGLTEITDEAYAYARKEAQKTTLRDDNLLSEWASKLGKHTNNPVSKAVSFLINSAFPFKRSYANIGVRAVEYSPLGLLTTTAYDIWKAARRKDAKMVTKIIDDLAANVTGTLLMGLGEFLAREGLLRARGAEDDKEREQLKREGYLENAFYIGDTPIPIAFLGSVSIPLLMGASIYEAIQKSNNTEEGMTFGDYLEVTSRILDPLTETTMFEGVMEAVNDFASNNPDESLSGAIAAGITTTIGNYISSLIPTVISRAAGAVDKAQRTTYIEPDSQMPQVDKMVQGIMKKDPIGRQKLTEKVDAYGNTVQGGLPDTGNKAKDIAGAVGYILTPTFPGEIKTTAVDEEMRRLYNDKTVDRDKYTLFVADAPKSFTVDGEEVELTSEQYTQFAKDRNSGIQSMRNSVLTNENYADLPGNAKGKAMHDAKEYAEALAKAGLGVGYKLPEKWMENLAGATPEEVAEAIIQRAIQTEATNTGENTYLGLGEMLESNAIDDQLAIACLSATSQNAYEAFEANCVPAGIGIGQFLDVYGAAKAADKDDKDIQKEAALEAIGKLDLTPEQKGALATAVYNAIGKIISVDTPVSEQWLLDIGDIDRLEIQMGRDAEKQPDRYVRYKTYIKDSPVDMQTYLDFYNFQKSDEAEGENRQDKIIAWLENLDATDEVKGRLFCTVYARSNCPLKWRTDVPRD